MKKLLVTMLTIMTCGAAYALPVGNPADPILLTQGVVWDECAEVCDPCDPCAFDWDMFSLRFGYYGDFVFNRDLELDGANSADDNRIDHAEIYTNAGLLVLNIWDRIDIYGTLGGTNAYLASDSSIFGIAPGRLEFETDTEFSWSVGVRGVLWECGCTSIGLDARYFRTRPDVRRITYSDTVSIFPDDDLEIKYREWQVSLGIAHRINMFVPYFAVKWSKADLDFVGSTTFPTITFGTLTLADLDARSHWGYAFGVSLVDCEMMSLNVEARLRDEKAVAVNAQIRF